MLVRKSDNINNNDDITMDLHDLAIELFYRFDPDQRGYITQEQLLDSAKDDALTEGQIISVFTLLDKENKGIITLSDFTDAFVDVTNENESEVIAETSDIIENNNVNYTNHNGSTMRGSGQESTISDKNEANSRKSSNSSLYGNRRLSSGDYNDEKDSKLRRKSNGSSVIGSTEKCSCLCNKSQKCQSNLRVKCCKYDRSMMQRGYHSSTEFLNDLLYIEKNTNSKIPRSRRESLTRKFPLVRRESSPNIYAGSRRVENIKSNLYKSKRWKSYDNGMDICRRETQTSLLNETNRENDISVNDSNVMINGGSGIINGDIDIFNGNCTVDNNIENDKVTGDYKDKCNELDVNNNIVSAKYDSSLCLSELAAPLSNKLSLFPPSHYSSHIYHSDPNLDKRGKDITQEFDEIFGASELIHSDVSKIGCDNCKLNRSKMSETNNFRGRRRLKPNTYDNYNLFTVNGCLSDENLNYHNCKNSSYTNSNSNVKRKLIYENEERRNSGGLTSNRLHSSTASRKKNGFLSSRTTTDFIITNENNTDDNFSQLLSEILEEEWGTYLRRIGGGALFLGNLTLQYLWQQIKLYQSDLVFPFDKFLKSVIDEQRSIYSKFQETENTLHMKIEQHEKEINNLYEEFDIAREKEVRKLERKQHDREEHLKNEFRKIIDYKEQAYQECCKQMTHITEKLDTYEEEMSSLQVMKKKAEEQCKYLLQEQQRYLAENQHILHENEILKQKYKSCKSSIADMQDHLDQLKQAADSEREKHRSFLQQYNDIVDEKTFLETSLANLSIENGELRNIKTSQQHHQEPRQKEELSISQILPNLEFNDLTDFPLCSSSPVKTNHFLSNKNNKKKYDCNHNNHYHHSNHYSNSNDSEEDISLVSLLDELNTSDVNLNDSMTSLKPIPFSTRMSSSPSSHETSHEEPFASKLISEDCEPIVNGLKHKTHAHLRNQEAAVHKDSLHQECFNITHHFIACDKLSISNYHEESLELLNKSFLSFSDPLIKAEAATAKVAGEAKNKNKKNNRIHLAAPFKSDFKIIFCGDSNVGKTSLIYRICFGYFRSSFQKDTVEVDTFVKNVENGGQNFKLKIWDTVGQEKFHSVPHSYYRKADVAIILYDITNEKTFESLETWMDNINKYSDNVLTIIIGNKLDLSDQRAIKKQRGEQFAKNNEAVFIETSAKSGDNIDRLLYLLTTKLLDQNEFVLIQNYFEQSTLNDSPMKKQCCN